MTSPVILLMGPTASGKTDLALRLAVSHDCEIVSVDSAQIYRDMDVGTAKPTPAERARVAHHLIDIRDPAEPYSAMDFVHDARRCIAEIHARGRTPLLVGGTMLYFRALVFGMAEMPASDPAVRQVLEQQLSEQGHAALHARLAKIDAVAAAGMPPTNTQRLLRALEVFEVSGRPISDYWRDTRADFPWPRWELALSPASRASLHARINSRFDQMLEAGLVDEVARLRARGDLVPDLPSMRCVGYRQVWHYLDGKIDYDAMVESGKAASRQLAKRQLTWLRSWPGLSWLDSESSTLEQEALKWLASSPI